MARESRPVAVRLLRFWGSSLDELREFPEGVRREAGFQLDRVQNGLAPLDFKPMPDVGPGVLEIRIRDESGIYRVLYATKFEDAVYVLHCFQKKTQRTAKGDIDLASKRYAELVKEKTMSVQGFASVWDAIEDTPAQAETMRLRSSLMMAIGEHIRERGLSQTQAAKLFGVTQPRISDLVQGKINLFSIDTLVTMLSAAEMGVEMKVLSAAKQSKAGRSGVRAGRKSLAA